MKKTLFTLMLSALMTMLFSCSDDNIGSSLVDTRTDVINDSSFVITGHSVPNHRLQSLTSTQLLGLIKSEGYGTLSSQVVTQFMPSVTIDTTGVTEDMIDSCYLALRIANGGFTGDATAPMRLSVYRLNKQLPNPIYSDLDPSEYYDPFDMLGEAAYSPQSATLVYRSTTDTTSYYETRVPMPVDLARELFREYKRNTSTFNSPTTFAKFFPGMFITNSYGSGRMMNYNYTELTVFYRKHLTTIDGRDSISEANRRVYMAASPEVLSNNILHIDIDPTIQASIDVGDPIVVAPGGYEVQVQFPIQDIIDTFNHNTHSDLGVINNVTLTIPVDDVSNTYNIAPPTNLLMVKTSKKDLFIAGDSLTNNKDSFYAVYDKDSKSYIFSGLRAYVLNIINKKMGIAEADDINLTITPVDITTYNTSSSYYTSASSVVTKIAPQVSKPAVAHLRLDKAKVMITYTKQTVL